ncbi:MAG: hypothetical protein ACYCX7_04960, partial [Solirubrobacteraceae bacterium]
AGDEVDDAGAACEPVGWDAVCQDYSRRVLAMRILRRASLLAALISPASVALAALAMPSGAALAAGNGSGHGRSGAVAAKRARSGRGGSRARSSSAERSLEASILIRLTPPEESLPITDRINLYVPEHFRDAGASLPHCSFATLHNRGTGGCPKGSIVGDGKAIGYTILGGQFVIEHLAVTLVNGPNAELLSWVEGHTPVAIEEVVDGMVSKPSGFGEEMSFTLPHDLLEPLPGAPGWLQSLEAHLSAKAGWLRTTSCPPQRWALKAELAYENGQGTTVEAKLRCGGAG